MSEGTIRDALLLKCKQAIEDLHSEIDKLNSDRRLQETAMSDLETEKNRLLDKFSQSEREKTRSQEELQRLRSRNQQMQTQIEYYETQINQSSDINIKYTDLKNNFQEIIQHNNNLKIQLDDALNDIQEKNAIKIEWEKEIENVSIKIQQLQQENCFLLEEKQKAYSQLNSYQQIIEQLEEQISMLQEQLREKEESESVIRKQFESQRSMQNDYEKANVQVDKLKRQLEQLRIEKDRSIYDLELQQNKALKDLSQRFEKEKHQIQQDALKEVDNLQNHYENLSYDIERVKDEKERATQELNETRDVLIQKEYQLKEFKEEYSRKFDESQAQHFEEIKKLQNIIDDQSELIRSYERVVEKEKSEIGQKVNENKQIHELQKRNSYLQNKLYECQNELQKIQNELGQMFNNEEKKYQEQIKDLEMKLDQSKKQLYEKEKEVEKQKLYYKQKKTEGNTDKKDVQRKIRELEDEKEQVVEKVNKKWQRQVDDLMLELELEKKKSMLTYNENEKIRNIEIHYQQEIDYLKSELMRKEVDFDKIKSKYDESIQKILSTRETGKSGSKNKENTLFKNQQLSSLGTLEGKKRQGNSDSSFVKSETDKSHASVERKRKKTVEKDKKEKQGEFLDKFKNVISRMEGKLERMQQELNLNSDTEISKKTRKKR